jgi:hypothetical protein
MQTSQLIPALTATVTKPSRSIAILPGLQPQRRQIVTQRRDRGPITARMLPRLRAPTIRQLIPTSSELIIRSILILIRGPLITVTRRLILIRPGLIPITRSLIALTRRLIHITRRNTRRQTHKLSPAGPAGRNP